MLLAQVHTGEDPDHIITILERIAAGDTADRSPRSDFSADHRDGASPAGGEFLLGGAGQSEVVAEERIPVVEEELRVGTREVVRGGARVRTRVEEIPVRQEVELVEEHASVERRPVTRQISEAELEAGGLLRERVIEIAQIREEAVVTKEAFVREEVVVTKSLERRVEQIHETIRRTEVETDELGAEAPRSNLAGSDDARSDFPR
jgi:stress response protein YsnF